MIDIKNKRIDAILFDWDNTLVDTMDTIHDATNQTLQAFGFKPWTKEETLHRIHRSLRERMDEIFGDKAAEASRYFCDIHDKEHLKTLKFLPGAQSLLKDIRSKEIPLGVVSNKRSGILREQVHHLLGEGFFDTIIGAGDTAHDKPAPDMAFLALDNLKIENSKKVWFVGDSFADWQCGYAAGCFVVAVGSLEQGENKHKIDLSVADCPELEKIIKNF